MNKRIFILITLFAINIMHHTSPMWLWNKIVSGISESTRSEDEVPVIVQRQRRTQANDSKTDVLHHPQGSQVTNALQLGVVGTALAKKVNKEERQLIGNAVPESISYVKMIKKPNPLCNKSTILLDSIENEQPIGNDVLPAEIVYEILLGVAKGGKLADSMIALHNFALSSRAHYRLVVDESTMGALLKYLLAAMKNGMVLELISDLKKELKTNANAANKKPELLPEFKCLVKKLLTLMNEKPASRGKLGDEQLKTFNEAWQESLELFLENGLNVNQALCFNKYSETETLLSKALSSSNVNSALHLLNNGAFDTNDCDNNLHIKFYIPGYMPTHGMRGAEVYSNVIIQLVNAGLSANSLVIGDYKDIRMPFLAFAIVTDDEELARFLIKAGANMDQAYETEDGGDEIITTPLKFAEHDADKQAFVELFNEYKNN